MKMKKKKKETLVVSHQLKESVPVQKLKEGEDRTKGFCFLVVFFFWVGMGGGGGGETSNCL